MLSMKRIGNIWIVVFAIRTSFSHWSCWVTVVKTDGWSTLSTTVWNSFCFIMQTVVWIRTYRGMRKSYVSAMRISDNTNSPVYCVTKTLTSFRILVDIAPSRRTELSRSMSTRRKQLHPWYIYIYIYEYEYELLNTTINNPPIPNLGNGIPSCVRS